LQPIPSNGVLSAVVLSSPHGALIATTTMGAWGGRNWTFSSPHGALIATDLNRRLMNLRSTFSSPHGALIATQEGLGLLAQPILFVPSRSANCNILWMSLKSAEETFRPLTER